MWNHKQITCWHKYKQTHREDKWTDILIIGHRQCKGQLCMQFSQKVYYKAYTNRKNVKNTSPVIPVCRSCWWCCCCRGDDDGDWYPALLPSPVCCHHFYCHCRPVPQGMYGRLYVQGSNLGHTEITVAKACLDNPGGWTTLQGRTCPIQAVHTELHSLS